jgi:TonB family protein
MIGLLLLLSGAGESPPAVTPAMIPPSPRGIPAPPAHAPATPRTGPAIISNPDWERMPDGDQLADLYPDLAREFGVFGKARIQCRVLADGRLSDCFVLSEAPAGFDFGDATLRAARYFKMRPKTINGRPVEGGTVIIPITWALAADDDRPARTAADLPAAETCLGWTQARADQDRSAEAFATDATMVRAYGEAAGAAGLKPTQMVEHRRQARARIPASPTSEVWAQTLETCRKAFGVEWLWAPADPPLPPTPVPELPPAVMAYLAQTRTASERCATVLGGELERSSAPDEAQGRAYAAWSRTLTWTSRWAGLTSAQIDDRLAALAREGLLRRDAGAVAECVKASNETPPAG